MAETFKHHCIKPGCPNTYEDTDPDAYYCPQCVELKKAIAKKVDEKMAGFSQKPVESDLQKYNRLKDASGFIHYKAL